MNSRIGIGIIAPSSQVPKVEFDLGLEQLKSEGFRLFVHPQCRRQHRYFAGRDEERAKAFYDSAMDPKMPVLWCARGGYGAMRILPYLDRMSAERGIPPEKLLVGYSDATALLEYARTRWRWPVLHAPMPGIRAFCTLNPAEREPLMDWIRGRPVSKPWGRQRLRFAGSAPASSVEGTLIGGNLSVWTSLAGTPYAPQVKDKILFFEDISEGLYRLDRMIHQISLSGGFKNVRAVVLGNFEGCVDLPQRVLVRVPAAKNRDRILRNPQPSDMGPLRKKLDAERLIPQLFAEVCEELGIPVAYGLPVGHGPGHASLPLGAKYRLGSNGNFELLDWKWLKKRG